MQIFLNQILGQYNSKYLNFIKKRPFLAKILGRMGKSNLIRNSVLILGALLAWQAIKDHRLKTARETRNDRYAMMEDLWTDEQIEHVKESMRNVGKFLATSGIDNKCTVDHIGERQELLEGILS